MDPTNVSFLENQAVKSLKAFFGISNTSEVLFQVQFDPSDSQQPKTNWDEIMYYRVIPQIAGKSLSLHEACKRITTGTNDIPLWIKVAEVNKDQLYYLLISKRFRKLKVLQEWHQDNQFLPFRI